MQKTKLYLDTSAISHIDASDVLEKESITQRFFRFVEERADEFELYVSPVVDLEIRNCPVPKRLALLALIERMKMIPLLENQEVLDLANQYVEHDVLSRTHIRDLTHVAYATVARCEYVVSWNMKHLVKARTISGVNTVNLLNRFSNIIIVTPLVIVGE